MANDVAARLVALNKSFYEQVSAPFARSRATPQPGFERLVSFLPDGQDVLDVGCGEGRFGRFLREHMPTLNYTGLDFTQSLLDLAAEGLPGRFIQADISKPGFSQSLGRFDLVVCLAALQHIPGAARRRTILAEMVSALKPGGRLFLSTWQFTTSERQQRKIRTWSEIGLDKSEVEPTDYLLSWRRGTEALRYVALLEVDGLRSLADQLECSFLTAFRSDGREGDLNLYVVWQK